MENFKKTTTVAGRWKYMTAANGKFINEDGEEVNIAEQLEQAYGNIPFDISTSAKIEEEVE